MQPRDSKMASGACLKPLPQLCRLQLIRRIQISRHLSWGSEPKKKDSSVILGRQDAQDLWCEKTQGGVWHQEEMILSDLEYKMCDSN